MSMARSRAIFQRLRIANLRTIGAFFLDVVNNKLSELIDDRNRVFVTLLLGVSPGEKAVAAQDDAVTVRTLLAPRDATSWPVQSPDVATAPKSDGGQTGG